MLDTYVTSIRQVAALLGYCKPWILEVFKNTLPTRIYWVLFPIDDLRLAVETAKRILTKEKIDRQLAGQSSLTPFMNIRDRYNSKKVVTFDTQNRLDDKIDKLMSMMSKLTAQGNNENSLNLKFIKAKGEEKQGITMINAIIRIDTDQIVVIGECLLGVELGIDRITEEGNNMLLIIEMTLGEEILGKCKIKEISIIDVNIETIIEMTNLEEVDVGLGKEIILVILEGMI